MVASGAGVDAMTGGGATGTDVGVGAGADGDVARASPSDACGGEEVSRVVGSALAARAVGEGCGRGVLVGVGVGDADGSTMTGADGTGTGVCTALGVPGRL